MKNPDAVKDGLTIDERELLHGLLMQSRLYPGSVLSRSELPVLVPGIVDPMHVAEALVKKGLLQKGPGDDVLVCLPLGYQIGSALTEEDLARPDAGLAPGLPPGWEWPVENPHNVPWRTTGEFLNDVSGLSKDTNLRNELLKTMAAALADTSYGKPQRGPRAGQRNARVSRNFRLFWKRDGREVVFLQFGSKEDPRVAPRGR
jgi:hypothetical protein